MKRLEQKGCQSPEAPGSQQPAASQQPADNSQPAASSQQRAATSQQPAASSQQPAASNQQPAASSCHSSQQSQQPAATSNQQPAPTGQQPAASRRQTLQCKTLCDDMDSRLSHRIRFADENVTESMPGSKFELKMIRCATTIDLTSCPMQTDRKSDSKFQEKVHKNHVPAHRISKKNKADVIDTLWICNHFQSLNRNL